jgi:hypothetical protein
MEVIRETSCRFINYKAAFSRVRKFMDNASEEHIIADAPGLKNGSYLAG